jgi:hypothetical protein
VTSDYCFQVEKTVVDQQQAQLHLYCRLIYPQHLWSEIKRGIHTLALDTPYMSPTEWYCPPVPSQCNAICSNCFSLTLRLWLVSRCKKGPIMLRSSFSLKLDRTSCYIHNCPPSHLNSFCFCKFFVSELPQVHSRPQNHWTTYWLNFHINTMSSLSFCITQSSERD